MRTLIAAALLAAAAVAPSAQAGPEIPDCITGPCTYQCVMYPCYPMDYVYWTLDQLEGGEGS